MYVAIENRLGLQYFLGHPDDHVNVRFITFLPRFMANIFTKLRRNIDYRTYIYSPMKLQQIIAEAGFNCQNIYSIYPHYGKISRMVPMRIFNAFKKIAKQGYTHIKIFVLSLAWRCIPEPIGKYFSPSLSVLAAKTQFSLPQRLVQVLIDKNLVPAEQASDYELVLMNNRFDNGHTTNYIVYNAESKQRLYFCKISRVLKADCLAHESQQLVQVTKQLRNTTLLKTIPELLFYDVVDGVSIQVTAYVNGQPISKETWNALRSAHRFVRTSLGGIKQLVALLQRYGRKHWLKAIDPWMVKSIHWLVAFQEATQQGSMCVNDIIESWLPQQLAAIEKNELSLTSSASQVGQLKQRLMSYQQVQLPLVVQHGDFDVCNILKLKQEIFVVDFEHAEANKLPFFDLANFIFSPLLSEWKASSTNQSLIEYVQSSVWQRYLSAWVKIYAEGTKLDVTLVWLLLTLAVLEQNAKQYPHNRDPYDYPMYGQESLDAILSLGLCDKF